MSPRRNPRRGVEFAGAERARALSDDLRWQWRERQAERAARRAGGGDGRGAQSPARTCGDRGSHGC